MSLSRRTLLGAFVLPLLTGCGSRSDTTATDAMPTVSATARATSTDAPTAGAETASPGDGADGRATPSHRSVGSVTVVNDALEDRYVTVVVESGSETHLLESRTVLTGTGVTFDGAVPSPDTYRVVVETASGPKGAFDWEVTETFDELRIRLTDGNDGKDETGGVTFSRPVVCDPTCPDVAVGGRATGYPDGGFDPRGRRAGSELRVHNAGEETRTVRVRVADGAVLDYRYRLPPTVTLTIPVPQRSGETPVSVDVDGDGRTFGWSMETNPVRRVTVGQSN